MAKPQQSNTATRVRKKVKKNIADGIAHVHASFNNTICLGQPPVVRALRARENQHLSLPRWLQRLLVKQRLNVVLKI